MIEVFCKNCSYQCFDDYDGRRSCVRPTGKIIKNYISGHYKESITIYLGEPNYPNDKVISGCGFYKRKFWKFWIDESG